MGYNKVLAKILWQAFDQLGQWDGRCVGRDYRIRTSDFSNAAVEILFDIQPLNNHLNDPVIFCQPLEIIFGIADLNPLGNTWVHQPATIAGFQKPVKRTLSDLVAATIAAVRRYDIQQQHLSTAIGGLGGDTRPHHPGADHGDLLNRFQTTHTIRSRISAIPCPPPMHIVIMP